MGYCRCGAAAAARCVSCHTELCSNHQRRLHYTGDTFCDACKADALAGRAAEIADSLRAAGVRTTEECALRIISDRNRGLYRGVDAGVSPIAILESFSGQTPEWASAGEWLEGLLTVLNPPRAELDEVVWEKYEQWVTPGGIFSKAKWHEYVEESGTVTAWVIRATNYKGGRMNYKDGRDWPYSILVTDGGQIVPAGIAPDFAGRLRYEKRGTFEAFSEYDVTVPSPWKVADQIRDRVSMRECLSSWDSSCAHKFRSAVADWMIEKCL